MTLAIREAQIGKIPCYGNPAVDCEGAEISAQSRHLATLLTISGAVDAKNVDALYERGGCFVLSDTSFVLDLSGVTSFGAEGVALLIRLEEACRAASIEWALVASSAVSDRLGCYDRRYPFASSVPEALHRFAASIFAQRRALLPMLTKTA
jgi:anti-anti-sigma regulatory factor